MAGRQGGHGPRHRLHVQQVPDARLDRAPGPHRHREFLGCVLQRRQRRLPLQAQGVRGHRQRPAAVLCKAACSGSPAIRQGLCRWRCSGRATSSAAASGSISRHFDRVLSVPAPTSNPTTTTPILPQLCQSTGCSSYPSGASRVSRRAKLATGQRAFRLHQKPRTVDALPLRWSGRSESVQSPRSRTFSITMHSWM